METDQLSPNNPLYFTPDPEPSAAKPKINPKIFLFGGLLIVSLFLLVVSTIVSQSKNRPTTLNISPTSVPPTAPKNTIPPSINVPTQYQQPLNQIDTEIKTQLQFAPPEIDQEIGQ